MKLLNSVTKHGVLWILHYIGEREGKNLNEKIQEHGHRIAENRKSSNLLEWRANCTSYSVFKLDARKKVRLQAILPCLARTGRKKKIGNRPFKC